MGLLAVLTRGLGLSRRSLRAPVNRGTRPQKKFNEPHITRRYAIPVETLRRRPGPRKA